MSQDYYELLGVDRNADDKSLRRAFRQKAKQYHPDLNPDSEEAGERFKAINEAYDVLRDEKKRAIYDRFGHAGLKNSGGMGGAGASDFTDLGDLFEQFFNFGTGTRRAGGGPAVEAGSNLRTRLKLEFEEAVFGRAKQIEIQRRETCESCKGDGAEPGSGPSACQTCQGAGEVRRVQQSVFGSFVNVQTCPQCRGRGQIVSNPCSSCKGQGRSQRKRTLEVDVPAGVEDGTQIRLSGEGDHGRFGGPPGDLYVVLKVSDHPVFERIENDLHIELRLNPADAALGMSVEIPTLSDPVEIDVPPGTQSGDSFVVKSQGVPFLRRAGRGDLLINAFVATPKNLSAEQAELLAQLRSTLPASEVVERNRGQKSFWQKLRSKFS